MDFAKLQKSISENRADVIKNLGRFLPADTLLFWSDNEQLHELQKKHWQPLLKTLNSVFKMDLQITTGLAAPENREATEIFAQHLNKMSDKELAACYWAASAMKSVLLGLLLAKQKISTEQALFACFLEEIYQNKRWGEDVAALNLRRQIQEDLSEIERYLKVE